MTKEYVIKKNLVCKQFTVQDGPRSVRKPNDIFNDKFIIDRRRNDAIENDVKRKSPNLEQNENALVPRRDRDGHFTAVRERYAVPSAGSVAGRVRAPPAVVRVPGTRRQNRRTDSASAAAAAAADDGRVVNTGRWVAVVR